VLNFISDVPAAADARTAVCQPATGAFLPGRVDAAHQRSSGVLMLVRPRGINGMQLPMGDEDARWPDIQWPASTSALAYSPDGRWLAYSSDDTGNYEIYVQSFSTDGKLGSDKKR